MQKMPTNFRHAGAWLNREQHTHAEFDRSICQTVRATKHTRAFMLNVTIVDGIYVILTFKLQHRLNGINKTAKKESLWYILGHSGWDR